MDSTSKNIYQGDGTKINTPLENTTGNIVPIVYDKATNTLKTKDEDGNIIEIGGGGGSYPEGTKIYRALLTQSGTNDPVVDVLQNTFEAPANLQWTRVSAGVYDVTDTGLTAPFIPEKTQFFLGGGDDGAGNGAFIWTKNSGNQPDSMQLFISTGGGDDYLYLTPLTIIVFP
jgi:hypothetical protein